MNKNGEIQAFDVELIFALTKEKLASTHFLATIAQIFSYQFSFTHFYTW